MGPSGLTGMGRLLWSWVGVEVVTTFDEHG